MGNDGGGIDLNFGTPEPVLSAIRSESPLPEAALSSAAEVATGSSSAAEVRRSE